MKNYKLTKQADQDIEDILFYTKQNWGDIQMEKYAKQIFDTIDYICNYPEIGSSVSYISQSTRKTFVGTHIIFYQLKFENIWILRILHTSMDIQVTFNL
jgi:toxin ParE1/3/4